MERALALVVDKDPAVRAVIRDVFEEHNVMVLGAGSGRETQEFLKSRPIGILMVDFSTPGVESLDLLHYGEQLPQAPVLIGISPSSDGQRSNELVKSGTFDVLGKPIDEHMLQQIVLRALRQHELLDDLRKLREELQSREGYHGLVGRSAPMERLRERLRRIAPTRANVWFAGEEGTGKELAARTLQHLAGAADAPFVVVPCGGLSADWEARWNGENGLLGQVRGGALYLEDVPDLPLDLQDRLPSVLAGGDSAAASGQVRVLSSSRIDPDEAVREGKLLEQVRGRLGGETLRIPPLRERVEDIPLLARHFISTICEINHLTSIQLAPDSLSLMERYHWPGNVQELRNAMEQGVILSSDGVIHPGDLPDPIREVGSLRQALPYEGASTRPFREAKREVVEIFEKGYLRELMERHAGNVTAASQQAGMLRSALQRLLRKYGLKSAEFRQSRRAAAGTQDSTRTSVD